MPYRERLRILLTAAKPRDRLLVEDRELARDTYVAWPPSTDLRRAPGAIMLICAQGMVHFEIILLRE